MDEIDDTSRRRHDGSAYDAKQATTSTWKADIVMHLLGFCMLAACAALVAAPQIPFSMAATTNRMIDDAGMRYAKAIVADCPYAVEPARRAMSDGSVDEAEIGVLDTHVEQVRALPGGLAACTVAPMHLDRGSSLTIPGI